MKYGDLLTADHFNLRSEESKGLQGERNALAMLDVATDYIGVEAALTKDATDTELALKDFNGKHEVRYFYSDDAGEIDQAARQLGWSHPKSAPYKHQANGVAENCVKRVKRGGKVVLLEAGFRPKWWPYAVLYWAIAHNICE